MSDSETYLGSLRVQLQYFMEDREGNEDEIAELRTLIAEAEKLVEQEAAEERGFLQQVYDLSVRSDGNAVAIADTVVQKMDATLVRRRMAAELAMREELEQQLGEHSEGNS